MKKIRLIITVLSLSAIAVSSCLLTTSCSSSLIKFGSYSFYKSAVVYVEFPNQHLSELIIGLVGQHEIIVISDSSFYQDAINAMHRAGF